MWMMLEAAKDVSSPSPTVPPVATNMMMNVVVVVVALMQESRGAP